MFDSSTSYLVPYPVVLLWSDGDGGWVFWDEGSRAVIARDDVTGAVTSTVGGFSGDWSEAIDGRWLTGATAVLIPTSSAIDPVQSFERLIPYFMGGGVAALVLQFMLIIYSKMMHAYDPLRQMGAT